MQRLYKGIALCLGLCLLFFALGGCEKEDVGYNGTAHSDVISQEPDSQADATSSEREGADDTSDMTHSDVISQETDSQTDATPSEREGTNNTSNMTRSDVISQEPDSQTDAMPSEREGTNDTSDIICSDAIGQETDNQTGTTPFQAHVIDRGVHAETNVAPFIMQSVQDVEDYHTRLETEYGFSDLKTQLNEIGIGYDNDYFEKKALICAVDVAGSTPTEYEVVRVYREGTQGGIEVQVTHQGMLAALQPTLFVIEVAREDLADSYTLERC